MAVIASSLNLTYKQGGILSNKHEHRVLKDASFSIKKGETFGVAGRNGDGKSTILKVLAEITGPDSGYLNYGKFIKKVALFSIGMVFDMELSGEDTALLSVTLQGMKKENRHHFYRK